MTEFLKMYFLESGLGWATIGAALVTMLGGIGSAKGIRIASAQGAGVLSEKPELFGRLLVLMAMPGTQGIYGFICAFLVAARTGLIAGEVTVRPLAGVGLSVLGLCVGGVLWKSAIFQGETSAACINMVAKRPEQSGRAIILPALVETYAVLGLLVAVLFIMWLT